MSLKNFKNNNLRNPENMWVILLFTKPKLYLYNLLKRTALTGILMLIIYEILKYAGVDKQAIPNNLHSLVGMVIGLLLVFRTNTSYDRWWEARKIFSTFQSILMYLTIKSKDFEQNAKIRHSLMRINTSLFAYVASDVEKDCTYHKEKFMKHCGLLGDIFFKQQDAVQNYGNLEKKISELIDQFCALERIKNTPIPISYALHIKLSVLIYLLSLPFGLFFEFGIVSIFFVMMLFFIIGGIEIISSEIENPFRDDPNDLPIFKFKEENEKYITHGNGQGQTKEGK